MRVINPITYVGIFFSYRGHNVESTHTFEGTLFFLLLFLDKPSFESDCSSRKCLDKTIRVFGRFFCHPVKQNWILWKVRYCGIVN